MNLTKKKKKGFTLIELMAVIAIIAILAAVLVPTVTGYIDRAKKTAIVTQVRNVVNAVETYNATAANSIVTDEITFDNTDKTKITADGTLSISKLVDVVGSDLLSTENINKLENMQIGTAIQINKNQDAVTKIKVNSNGTYKSYNGFNNPADQVTTVTTVTKPN